MKKKSKIIRHRLLELGIAAGAAIVLALWLLPDARLLRNDISNNLFEKQIPLDALAEEVPFRRDIPYCNTTDSKQTLDIFLPPSSIPTPLVVFIHGGGWTYGDKQSKVMSYYLEPLVKEGVAVASLNYRLHPQSHYPDAYKDIACALEHLQANASEYNISTEKWGIMGDSAGAELAAYALQSRPEIPITAFVGLYGPYDLGLQLTRTPKKDVDAANFINSHDPEFATSVSPISQPVKTTASYLLIHGTKDTIVPVEQSKKYYQHLKDAGADARLVLLPDSGHYVSPTGTPSREDVRTLIQNFFLQKQQP